MPYITGWSHTPFGKHDAIEVEELIREVANGAIEHAGVDPEQIDAIVVGSFNGGFVRQDFTGALAGLANSKLRHTPAMRVENACATGSAALYTGANTIEAGRAETVLVIGAEKMTELPTKEIGDVLLKASYVKEEADIPAGFAGVFGKIAQAYYDKYGDASDALAMIAAKNHKNGCANPYAHMRKDFGYEFCATVSDKNPAVAGPLRRTDCSLISDGAAAIILTGEHGLATARRAIGFRARTHVNEFLPLSRRDPTKFIGAEKAWAGSLAEGAISLDDLSLVETHDCFTIAELLEYEAMGLAAEGRGGDIAKEGVTAKNGKLPVNPSGGLKSKGHPIGATGVSMHVMASMQLMGEAGDMQIADATLAGVFNMGGAGVANYCSVLERVK